MTYLSAKNFINTPVPYEAEPITIGNITRWVGKAALTMAQTSGRNGGPGFEKDLLRDEIRSDPSWYLQRQPASIRFGASHQESWDWRIFNGKGQCVAQRLTSKAP